jgi:excisionase family DNA binding protein
MNKPDKKTKKNKQTYQKKQVEPLRLPALQRYLTKAEVAALLSVTGRYVTQMVSAGRLKALRVSHRILRFRSQDVEIFMNGGETISK